MGWHHRVPCFAAAALCAGGALAQGANLTEKDYLGELPVVYTVSRLPQPLNEAPGAVTVIDRELIRRSGARELADVLRLVPGFQVTYARGGNPLAAYHGAFFDLTPRLQVLIDGRSVYTVHYAGGTNFGMRSVPLEDIERIEVLRGSNSANYGARAFLGVVNVITRDPRQTHGAAASLSAGNGGIDDKYARVGWGTEDASWRVSANTRADRGLQGPTHDNNRLANVNFRGQLRIDSRDELELRGGISDQKLQDGFSDTPRFADHERRYQSQYLQADWRRDLAPGEEVSVQFSHMRETYRDGWFFPLPAPLQGVGFDYGGEGQVSNLSFNHRLPLWTDSRLSWGGEWRSENDRAPQTFNRPDWLNTRYLRLYGNLETRLHRQLILNVGAMLENSNETGTSLMPRAMLNWLVDRSNTLRAGVSIARRAPTAFERHADQRLFAANGSLVDWVWRTHGTAAPEQLVSAELGWFGELRSLGLTADARLFHERIRRFLEFTLEPLPPGTELAGDFTATFVNGRAVTLQGLELQMNWRPVPDTRIVASHAMLQMRVDEPSPQFATSQGLLSMPARALSLMWLQRLPGDFDASVSHVRSGPISWRGLGAEAPPWHRTDLRLARAFRIGATRAEASLTVQNATDRVISDFSDRLALRRRAFFTLRFGL